MKYTYIIKGLDCANCAMQLENEIKQVKGIQNAVINFFTEKLIIECNEENKDEVINTMKKVIKKENPDVTIEEI
ncbi:MAG: heavy metal transporter [Clostridiales bacterium]|nr:heavy metal transporter [Clostridiales bacterium]